MQEIFKKHLYTTFYLQDLEWLEQDLVFYSAIKKPDVKELYLPHIQWEISQLKILKDKIKQYV